MADSTGQIIEVSPEKENRSEIWKYLNKKQDFWWLNEKVVDGKKKTQLEDALEKGRSFKKGELLASKEWLNQDNLRTYDKTRC